MKHRKVLGVIVLSHVLAMALSLAGVLAPSVTALAATAKTLDATNQPAVAVPTAGASASSNASSSANSSAVGLKTKKSTEVNFDDVLVQGKYHFSDEAVMTVEQDKVLDALLGVRTDFKDRLSQSAARH